MCAKSRSHNEGEEDKPLIRKSQSYGSIGDKIIKKDSAGVLLEINKEKLKVEKKQVKRTKPDGGWGWLVVLGVALSNMSTQSLVPVFGLLFIERLNDLGIETVGAAAIMSVQTSTINFTGLIVGPITRVLSYRGTAATGSVFVLIGLLLTMFAYSLETYIIFYGLFTGFGLGLLGASTFMAINSYFTIRRGRAVGYALTGTCIGQMLLPLLVKNLLDTYGFQGTLLILAGISGNALVAALLYQPVEWHMKKTEIKEDPDENKTFPAARRYSEPQNRSSDSLRSAPEDAHIAVEGTKHSSLKRAEQIVAGSEKSGKPDGEKNSTILSKIIRSMGWDLLGNLSFLNLVISIGMVYAANQCFNMLFPFYLQGEGFPKSDIAYAMIVSAASDFLGRMTVPALSDKFRLTSTKVFFTGVALSAIARSGLATQNSLFPVLIMSSFSGYVRSAIIVNYNICISDNVDPEKLPSAVGMHMVFKGFMVITIAPLMGFLRDTTQSYSLTIHLLSIFCLILPLCLWLLRSIIRKHNNLSERRKLLSRHI